MKKVLIGLGIGCGTLMIVGVALTVAGGIWAKKNLGGMAKMGEGLQAQEERFKELDQEYPFTLPTPQKPLALTEDRLQAYLAIRDGALPIHKDFEVKAKELKAKYPDQGKANIGAALEAATLIGNLMTDLREVYLKGLEQQHMSPREFGAITGVIYTSQLTSAMVQQRPAMEKQLEQLTAQAQTATGDQKKLLDQQIASLKQALQSFPTGAAEATLAANTKLVASHKEHIQKAANQAFDLWVSGQFGQGMASGMTGIVPPGSPGMGAAPEKTSEPAADEPTTENDEK